MTVEKVMPGWVPAHVIAVSEYNMLAPPSGPLVMMSLLFDSNFGTID